jgi:hypothetical protein
MSQFHDKGNFTPARIFFFCDGVSKGEFEKVEEAEIKAFRGTLPSRFLVGLVGQRVNGRGGEMIETLRTIVTVPFKVSTRSEDLRQAKSGLGWEHEYKMARSLKISE